MIECDLLCVFFILFFLIGPLSDILQLLLTSIFDLQDQENDEIKETDVKMTRKCLFFQLL